MATFPDSFTQLGDDSFDSVESVPLQEDDGSGYAGYEPSQQFESFAAESDPTKDSNDDVFAHQTYTNGEGFGQDFGGLDGPFFPPPSEMEPDDAFALREWRRENEIRLEEKEKRKKEVLSQIIEEADQYKVEFYRKREVTCENYKANNREREKIFVVNQEKFHTEADKHYWKTIAELIPNEVPALEKRGKKDKQKPSIVVVKGPKPGKPADLSRMRQILLKLKHNTPPHLKHSPPPPPAPAKDQDAKSSNTPVTAAPPVTSILEAIVAA